MMTEKKILTEELTTSAQELGCLLQKTRKDKGLSVGEVAERLKLTARQVEDMEVGDYSCLKEPVFVRGFLRSYSRLLDLDDAIVTEYLNHIFPHAKSNAAVKTTTQQIPCDRFDLQKLAIKKTLPKWLLPLIIFLTLVGAIIVWQSSNTASPQEGSVANQVVQAGQEAMQQIDADNIKVISMPAEPSSALTVSQENAVNDTKQQHHLVIKLMYQSELFVEDGHKKILFQGVAQPDKLYQFDAAKPYQVKMTDARGATILLDGKTIAVPSTEENKASSLMLD